MKAKKSQAISVDLVIAIVIFAIIFTVALSLLFSFQKKGIDNSHELEMEYVFANLEHNLEAEQKISVTNRDFIKDYRIEKAKLNKFFSDLGTSSIDQYVIGNLPQTHGIGLEPESYDACLFFMGNDGLRLTVSGLEAAGYLKSGTCHDKIIVSNPCDDYKQSISLLKPVLLIEGSTDTNRILQMNLVICKK